jgi:hypothetical protein
MSPPSRSENKSNAHSLLRSDFLRSIFNRDDGVDMFLRNVGVHGVTLPSHTFPKEEIPSEAEVDRRLFCVRLSFLEASCTKRP